MDEEENRAQSSDRRRDGPRKAAALGHADDGRCGRAWAGRGQGVVLGGRRCGVYAAGEDGNDEEKPSDTGSDSLCRAPVSPGGLSPLFLHLRQEVTQMLGHGAASQPEREYGCKE